MTSNTNDAIRVLEEKLKANPDSKLFAVLAENYRQIGDINKAIDICNRGLTFHPNFPSGYIVLGKSYYDNKDLENAKINFTKALECQAENTVAMKYLGDIFKEQGNNSKAISYYKNILLNEPENQDIKNLIKSLEEKEEIETKTMAEVYEKQEHYDKALEIYKKLLTKNPNDTFLKNKIAELEKKKDKDFIEFNFESDKEESSDTLNNIVESEGLSEDDIFKTKDEDWNIDFGEEENNLPEGVNKILLEEEILESEENLESDSLLKDKNQIDSIFDNIVTEKESDNLGINVMVEQERLGEDDFISLDSFELIEEKEEEAASIGAISKNEIDEMNAMFKDMGGFDTSSLVTEEKKEEEFIDVGSFELIEEKEEEAASVGAISKDEIDEMNAMFKDMGGFDSENLVQVSEKEEEEIINAESFELIEEENAEEFVNVEASDEEKEFNLKDMFKDEENLAFSNALNIPKSFEIKESEKTTEEDKFDFSFEEENIEELMSKSVNAEEAQEEMLSVEEFELVENDGSFESEAEEIKEEANLSVSNIIKEAEDFRGIVKEVTEDEIFEKEEEKEEFEEIKLSEKSDVENEETEEVDIFDFSDEEMDFEEEEKIQIKENVSERISVEEETIEIPKEAVSKLVEKAKEVSEKIPSETVKEEIKETVAANYYQIDDNKFTELTERIGELEEKIGDMQMEISDINEKTQKIFDFISLLKEKEEKLESVEKKPTETQQVNINEILDNIGEQFQEVADTILEKINNIVEETILSKLGQNVFDFNLKLSELRTNINNIQNEIQKITSKVGVEEKLLSQEDINNITSPTNVTSTIEDKNIKLLEDLKDIIKTSDKEKNEILSENILNILEEAGYLEKEIEQEVVQKKVEEESKNEPIKENLTNKNENLISSSENNIDESEKNEDMKEIKKEEKPTTSNNKPNNNNIDEDLEKFKDWLDNL